jgi:hypothetical protein
MVKQQPFLPPFAVVYLVHAFTLPFSPLSATLITLILWVRTRFVSRDAPVADVPSQDT